MLTVDKFINNLNKAFNVAVVTNKHILSSQFFKDSFAVRLSEYGEEHNRKKCILIEQLDESKIQKYGVRLSLEELSSITNVKCGVAKITYKDGYSLNIFY